MAESIKLNGNKFLDTTSIYDSGIGEYQSPLNDLFTKYSPKRVYTTGGQTASAELDSGMPYLLIAGERGYGAFTTASLYLVSVTKDAYSYVLKVCDASSAPNISSVTIDNSTCVITVTFQSAGNKHICLLPLGA